MWDPETYLAFSDQRERPARDLLARMNHPDPASVVDLGCGTGNLAPLLTRRWPAARLEALDSAPEMVRAAVEAGVQARVLDVRDWSPGADTDVVVCNAVLQWVPDHVELVRGWLDALPVGAVFGMQLPGNFRAPAHRAVYELASRAEWGEETGAALRDALRDPDRVLTPLEYARALSGPNVLIDAWESTYVHRLHGRDPVLNWLRGTALRPVRALLDERSWERFLEELAPMLRSAYPEEADGSTWFPFRRVFVVVRRA
ncbi:trans-aconitate 2-methyltransferase [Actinopolyspora saharensis]|uniref:Trans-aconitate 2-methyltransferase n=1 Tax=Actinopolyspora saharensis TaxID=995062 RepID=A0A1H1DDY2_9ACTN|nr:trans-aconitate 2-methyltransferase [Actinopolyspora saharensis]SDQ74026.1 trans-aconitate 2-methyltransferase [Actinopolyspora saharensis]